MSCSITQHSASGELRIINPWAFSDLFIVVIFMVKRQYKYNTRNKPKSLTPLFLNLAIYILLHLKA